MLGNIKIVLTLSILKHKKNKDTVTTDWTENKINKVHDAYLCFIEFKVGNWSEKKNLLALFCIVCQYVISTGIISNTSIYHCLSYVSLALTLQDGKIISVDKNCKIHPLLCSKNLALILL